MALLHRRLGLKTAGAFAVEARAFDIEWVDQSLHDSAVDALRDAHRGVGLVDQVSFLVMRRRGVLVMRRRGVLVMRRRGVLVMRRRGVDSAFAFDRDFETAGFRLYRA